jgi:hypothetical protein
MHDVPVLLAKLIFLAVIPELLTNLTPERG